MKVVLDTSSLIYLNDFSKFEEIFTVGSVIKEVKDKVTGMKLSGLELRVVEADNKIVEEVVDAAKETGDLERLSKTDIEILAVAKQHDLTILSDDRNIQNVAEKLGINYISIFSKKITKLITWKKYCESCKKYYDEENVCPVCGAQLKRVAVSSEEIKKRG